MSEAKAWIPVRRSPLSARAPIEARRGAVHLGEMPFIGKHVLRIDPKTAATPVKKATGLDLPKEPMSSSVADEAALLWLGPDEWMLVTPPDDAGAMAAKLAEALASKHHQLVDVGDYYTAIDVHGLKARDLLMKLTVLDIYPRAFAAGQVTGTNFGHANATLWLVSDIDGDATFRLFVRWSHADYLWCLLADAGLEWGMPEQRPVSGEKLVI
jgi:heterotetrameric sarcosine oxidase gamma subunit